MKKIIFALVALATFLSAESVITKGLGFGAGYYRYEEVDTDDNNKFVMSQDLGRFSLLGTYKIENPKLKLETNGQISYGIGVYTGAVLNENNDGEHKRLVSISGAFIADVEGKIGYNLLGAHTNNKLYAQVGAGYYFNATQFLLMQRLQGYLYLPIELQSVLDIGNGKQLEMLVGYHHFVMGNHYSQASQYGFNEDMYETQKRGYGFKAHIGMNYVKDGVPRSARISYRYWWVDDSNWHPVTDATGRVNAAGNNRTAIMEPRNSSHIVDFQYVFYF